MPCISDLGKIHLLLQFDPSVQSQAAGIAGIERPLRAHSRVICVLDTSTQSSITAWSQSSLTCVCCTQ